MKGRGERGEHFQSGRRRRESWFLHPGGESIHSIIDITPGDYAGLNSGNGTTLRVMDNDDEDDVQSSY